MRFLSYSRCYTKAPLSDPYVPGIHIHGKVFFAEFVNELLRDDLTYSPHHENSIHEPSFCCRDVYRKVISLVNLWDLCQ